MGRYSFTGWAIGIFLTNNEHGRGFNVFSSCYSWVFFLAFFFFFSSSNDFVNCWSQQHACTYICVAYYLRRMHLWLNTMEQIDRHIYISSIFGPFLCFKSSCSCSSWGQSQPQPVILMSFSVWHRHDPLSFLFIPHRHFFLSFSLPLSQFIYFVSWLLFLVGSRSNRMSMALLQMKTCRFCFNVTGGFFARWPTLWC